MRLGMPVCPQSADSAVRQRPVRQVEAVAGVARILGPIANPGLAVRVQLWMEEVVPDRMPRQGKVWAGELGAADWEARRKALGGDKPKGLLVYIRMSKAGQKK